MRIQCSKKINTDREIKAKKPDIIGTEDYEINSVQIMKEIEKISK